MPTPSISSISSPPDAAPQTTATPSAPVNAVRPVELYAPVRSRQLTSGAFEPSSRMGTGVQPAAYHTVAASISGVGCTATHFCWSMHLAGRQRPPNPVTGWGPLVGRLHLLD